MLEKHFNDLTNQIISIARQKRGSFSFNVDVAHIIDSIIGLFRKKDTDELKTQLTNLVVHTEHQDHRLNAIEGHIGQLENSLGGVANTSYHAIWLGNANHMESMLIFALGIIQDTQVVLMDLMIGKVPSQLFSVPSLKVAYQNLTTISKLHGYEVAIHAPTEILRQPFEFFVNRTTLFFAFYLDIYDPNEEFKLLEHVNIPIVSSNETIIIKTEKKYLGISEGLREDRKSFSLSSLDFSPNCKEFDETESRYLCGEVVIDKDVSESCLASLYIGETNKCNIETFDEPPSSDYYFLTDGTIILFFPESTLVGYSCGIDNFTSFYVTGIYVPEIAENCKITTDKWIVHSDSISAISAIFFNQSILFDPEQLKPFEFEKEIDIPKFSPPPKISVKPPPQNTYYYGLNVSKDDFFQYVLIFSFGLILFCVILFFCIKTCIMNKWCCC